MNLALSSITSYPSTVGVIGLSSSCRLLTGSEMDRGQPEYSTDGSATPFTLARAAWLWNGGGVLLRLPRPAERDWRRKPPRPPPWSSRAALVMGDEDGLLETLPSDEARCGRLTLPPAPDRAPSMGTGTGTKGDAIPAGYTWVSRGCGVNLGEGLNFKKEQHFHQRKQSAPDEANRGLLND